MYYVEKIIEGILHYQTIPCGPWMLCSHSNLTSSIVSLKKKVLNQSIAIDRMKDYQDKLEDENTNLVMDKEDMEMENHTLLMRLKTSIPIKMRLICRIP